MTTLTAAHHPAAAPGLIWLTVVIVAAAWLAGLWIAGKLRRARSSRHPAPDPPQTPVTGHVVAHPRADKTEED